MVPRSQKDRPISFLLFDGEDFIDGRDLIIRPEELTRNEPFKTSIQQTLGGAWADDFGMAVATISISGHTGWHGSYAEDGAKQFTALRELLITTRKAKMDEKAKSGNPDDIRLVFADQLNNIVSYVAPQSFQLRRHKSRPLLMMYNITLSELGVLGNPGSVVTAQDYIIEAINNPKRNELAATSLAHIDKKQAQLDALLTGSGLPSDMVRTARDLMTTTSAVLTKVRAATAGVMGMIDEHTAALVHSSAMVLEASRNVFLIMASSDISEYCKSILRGISSNLLDAVCNLRNGWRRLFSIADWSDVFGASTCSSTGGGRPASPLAFENPFYKISPTSPAVGLSVTADAAAAIAATRGGDVVLAPPSLATAMDNGNRIAQGVYVT